jgi:hypothetical protein
VRKRIGDLFVKFCKEAPKEQVGQHDVFAKSLQRAGEEATVQKLFRQRGKRGVYWRQPGADPIRSWLVQVSGLLLLVPAPRGQERFYDLVSFGGEENSKAPGPLELEELVPAFLTGTEGGYQITTDGSCRPTPKETVPPEPEVSVEAREKKTTEAPPAPVGGEPAAGKGAELGKVFVEFCQKQTQGEKRSFAAFEKLLWQRLPGARLSEIYLLFREGRHRPRKRTAWWHCLRGRAGRYWEVVVDDRSAPYVLPAPKNADKFRDLAAFGGIKVRPRDLQSVEPGRLILNLGEWRLERHGRIS